MKTLKHFTQVGLLLTTALFLPTWADASDDTPDDKIEKLVGRDYRYPNYLISDVWLRFTLDADDTIVSNRMTIQRATIDAPLVLDGEDLELLSVELNGKELSADQYELTDRSLTLIVWPELDTFVLTVTTKIHPSANDALSGLYTSGGSLVTQCESEGFRRITYFLDRPDVLSRYNVVIDADTNTYPYVMSNGNEVRREENDGRVVVRYNDPYAKPCYLFALVAGDFDVLYDNFETMSGKPVALEMYAPKGDGDRLDYAMGVLKKAMKWDEEIYGLEYDLDTLRVAGIHDFNAGAMENKGLLIFNADDLLADINTATDSRLQRVFTVIGHEYFHNWSGNRISIRDWLQLTMKEGFTTFREQCFTGDCFSSTLKRIEDSNFLRNVQFTEADGPMAHALVPDEVDSIENIYTATTYDKGAEIYRMLRWILGDEEFYKGCKLFFKFFDSRPVKAENFVGAMEKSSGRDLTLFREWYHRAETPELDVTWSYNRSTNEGTLTVNQKTAPMHIPLVIGMLTRSGQPMTMEMDGADPSDQYVLEITEPSHTFVFRNLSGMPAISMNRDFSAPVKVNFAQPPVEHHVLIKGDTNGFNRYTSCQRMGEVQIERLMRLERMGLPVKMSTFLYRLWTDVVLTNPDDDRGLTAAMLSLPGDDELLAQMQPPDFGAVARAKQIVRESFGKRYEGTFEKLYHRLHGEEDGALNADAFARRSLKNSALSHLMALDASKYTATVKAQYDGASNMSDRFAALALLVDGGSPERAAALTDFYDRFQDKDDVVNTWFSVQAGADRADVLNQVKALENHPAFDIRNPNRVRSLFGAFARNLQHFHHESGAGYEYIADKVIEIDGFNSHIAAGLVKSFKMFSKLGSQQQQAMENALQRVANQPGLSGLTKGVTQSILDSK